MIKRVIKILVLVFDFLFCFVFFCFRFLAQPISPNAIVRMDTYEPKRACVRAHKYVLFARADSSLASRSICIQFDAL